MREPLLVPALDVLASLGESLQYAWGCRSKAAAWPCRSSGYGIGACRRRLHGSCWPRGAAAERRDVVITLAEPFRPDNLPGSRPGSSTVHEMRHTGDDRGSPIEVEQADSVIYYS